MGNGPRTDRTDGLWTWVTAVLAVFVAGVLVAAHFTERPTPACLLRYPELRDADPTLVAAVRRRVARCDAEQERHTGTRGASPPASTAALFALLDQGGAASAVAVLRMVVADGELKSETGTFTHVSRSACRDLAHYPHAVWLSRNAGPAHRAVLVRMLADRGLDYEARRLAVVALCRKGNEAALDPLASVALDPAEETWLRRDVLLRIARIAGPPPARLRELLYLPSPQEEPLDQMAAGALAVLGDPEAPSFVLSGIHSSTFGCSSGSDCLYATAALAISRGDARVAEAAATARCREVDQTGVVEIKGGPSHEESMRAVAGAFEAWLADHPEATDTEFERGEREYLASDRRRRELAIDSFDAIRKMPEEDLDFAAAALVADEGFARGQAESLLALDRLARFLRARIAGERDSERIVATLNRYLLPPPGATHQLWLCDDGPISDLSLTLSGYWANCLGRTTLYLAVAERLGLPLRGVRAPGHVFIRWDCADRAFDVELTDGGRITDDSEYRTNEKQFPMSPDAIAEGVWLRSLTKREVLASVCLNLCQEGLRYERSPDHARTLAGAEHALALDPRCVEALLTRAQALANLDPGHATEALADCARALELEPRLPGTRVVAGIVCCAAGDHERALQWFADAIAAAPSASAAHAARIICLLRHGHRPDEARREIEAAPADVRPALAALRIEALVRLGDSRYRDALLALATEPADCEDALLFAGELVASGTWPAESARAEAAWLLQRIRPLDPTLDPDLPAAFRERLAEDPPRSTGIRQRLEALASTAPR